MDNKDVHLSDWDKKLIRLRTVLNLTTYVYVNTLTNTLNATCMGGLNDQDLKLLFRIKLHPKFKS